MKDVQKILQEFELSEPSDKQDMRMERLFENPPRPTRTRVFWRPVALWQCAAACALCVLIGFRLGEENPSQQAASDTHVVYVVQQPENFRGNVFDWTQYEEPGAFFDAPRTVAKPVDASNATSTQAQQIKGAGNEI